MRRTQSKIGAGVVLLLALATLPALAAEGRTPIWQATTITADGKYILTRDIQPRAGQPTIDITDGTAFGTIDAGAAESTRFFATHHDAQVVGYRWEAIAQAMGLRTDCR